MKRKRNTESQTLSGAIGIGLAASILSLFLLGAVIATLILSEKITEENMRYFTFASLFVSSLIGCLLSCKKLASKYALAAGLSGLSFLLILVAVGILFFDGGFSNLLINSLAVLIGTAIACAICISTEGRGNRRKMLHR